jgi:hypothetical protein
MTAERSSSFDERTRRALSELQDAIVLRYPTTTFEVSRGADDPRSVHLIAIVDVDDPDEVGDLVLDRVIDLVADEGIPIHVIPVHTPERIAADREERRRLGSGSRRMPTTADIDRDKDSGTGTDRA